MATDLHSTKNKRRMWQGKLKSCKKSKELQRQGTVIYCSQQLYYKFMKEKSFKEILYCTDNFSTSPQFTCLLLSVAIVIKTEFFVILLIFLFRLYIVINSF